MTEPVQVGDNGEAEISFRLPNFDGRLKWMFVAFNDNQFGSADAYTEVASPVVVQISAPRFLLNKDESLVAIDVHNRSGEQQSLDIQIATDGGLEADINRSNLVLDDQGRAHIKVEVRAVSNGKNGTLTVRVANKSGSITLQRESTIPVRSAWAAVTRVERTHHGEGEVWRPGIKTADLQPANLRAQLVLSSYPALDVDTHFEYLLAYPYGCLEQLTSRGLPWLYVNDEMVRKLDLDQTIKQRFSQGYSDQLRREQLEHAVRQLQGKQKSSGAFSVWNVNGPEDLWLTIFATDFLVQASQQGIIVPRRMLQRALSRLQTIVRRPGFQVLNRWVRNKQQYDFIVASYASFVLARANAVSLADVRRVMDGASKDLLGTPLPWMHLGIALRILGDHERSKTAISMIAKSQRDPDLYLGDYGGHVRDTVWTIRYAAQFKVDAGIDLFDLQDVLRGRNWLSTQERTHLLHLAVRARERGDHIDVQLDTAKGQRTIVRDQAYRSLLTGEELQSLTSITSRSSDVFTELSVIGYPLTSPQPVQNDIAITKRYFHTDGSRAVIDEVSSGELIIVRLEVEAAHDTPDALIVDLLPAGFELENQNLSAGNVLLRDVVFSDDGSRFVPNQSVVHEEFREDRYVAALWLNRNVQSRVYYLARAVTPGRYTIPAAFVEDMYRPQRFGRSETAQFRVLAQ